MKRGQSFVGMTVTIVIFVIVLAVIAFIFYRPNFTTGQVVSDLEERNYLNRPFELRAWVVSSEGIKLDVKNLGNKYYSVNSFEIEGCGPGLVGKSLSVGESRIFEAKCSLVKGNEFNGKITIVYSAVAGGENEIAEGFVNDFV